MRFFDSDQVAEALPWSTLISAIETTMVTAGATAPERTVHQVEVPGAAPGSLLLKPGWIVGDVIAVKAVTFFPGNGKAGLATVNAGVLLFDGLAGTLVGACDGNELTARRTAAASAVAAKRLARRDASRLLVLGTGALAPMTAHAHCEVRDYELVEVWGRSQAKAQNTVRQLVAAGVNAQVSTDLDASVSQADTISCVTGSMDPLVRGELLRQGSHLDLIGAFTPAMRESDDEVIRRGDVWVDTRADGVLAGDLAQPLAAGLFSLDDIQGDLAELIDGTCPVRSSERQITVFKSAGSALEDVAAAKLVFS